MNTHRGVSVYKHISTSSASPVSRRRFTWSLGQEEAVGESWVWLLCLFLNTQFKPQNVTKSNSDPAPRKLLLREDSQKTDGEIAWRAARRKLNQVTRRSRSHLGGSGRQMVLYTSQFNSIMHGVRAWEITQERESCSFLKHLRWHKPRSCSCKEKKKNNGDLCKMATNLYCNIYLVPDFFLSPCSSSYWIPNSHELSFQVFCTPASFRGLQARENTFVKLFNVFTCIISTFGACIIHTSPPHFINYTGYLLVLFTVNLKIKWKTWLMAVTFFYLILTHKTLSDKYLHE